MSKFSSDTITQRHVELARGFGMVRATLDAIANDVSMPELERLQRQHDLITQNETEAVSAYALESAGREHEIGLREMARRLEEMKQDFMAQRRKSPILQHFVLLQSAELAKAEVASAQRQHDDMVERGIKVEPRHTYAAQQSVRNSLWVMESFMTQYKVKAACKIPAGLVQSRVLANEATQRSRRPSLS